MIDIKVNKSTAEITIENVKALEAAAEVTMGLCAISKQLAKELNTTPYHVLLTITKSAVAGLLEFEKEENV